MNGDEAPEGQWQFKPGDTISPGAEPTAGATSQPAVAAPASEPVVQDPTAVAVDSSSPEGAISWTASEFVAHNKSVGWYLLLAGGALALSALIFVLTKDKIATGVVIIGAFVLGAYGARQPRQLQYSLTEFGLSIGEKYHPYEEFRSFAVVDEGAFASIVFLPLKRFAPLTTIYYDPEDEDKIIELLADRLPLEDRQHDAVDRFLRRIRY